MRPVALGYSSSWQAQCVCHSLWLWHTCFHRLPTFTHCSSSDIFLTHSGKGGTRPMNQNKHLSITDERGLLPIFYNMLRVGHGWGAWSNVRAERERAPAASSYASVKPVSLIKWNTGINIMQSLRKTMWNNLILSCSLLTTLHLVPVICSTYTKGIVSMWIHL